MALVNYSDSDSSDAEETPVSQPTPKPSKPSSKPAFQKVVDASNPGKIRVNLPSNNEQTSEQPAAKRVKTDGGRFSGFNSFLPPPKRVNQPVPASQPATGFKTGAAPGFSRDIEVNTAPNGFETENATEDTTPGIPAPKPDEVKLVGKPLMFKPLSVARKPTKKKKVTTGPQPETNGDLPANVTDGNNIAKPKVSLFSMSDDTSVPTASTANTYEPIIYATTTAAATAEDTGPSLDELAAGHFDAQTDMSASGQSLDGIASELNLSAAERRRLFGRRNGAAGLSATSVINFNTDNEYQLNEELRAAGQPQHNPVRSIAPGKHSIRQLISAAVSQKDALQESFAKSKATRAEAASKYGW